MTAQTAPGRSTQEETYAVRAGEPALVNTAAPSSAGSTAWAAPATAPQDAAAPGRGGGGPEQRRRPEAEAAARWAVSCAAIGPRGERGGMAAGGGHAGSEGGVRCGWGSSFSINKAPDWLGGFFFPASRALSLPVLGARWWARGREPGSRGLGVHLQVGCSLARQFSRETRNPTAGRHGSAALHALPGGPRVVLGASRALRLPPAAGCPPRWRESPGPGSACWRKAPRKNQGPGKATLHAAP